MITEDYVSFETAKLLKEKEFNADVNCCNVYVYGRVVSKDYIQRLDELKEYVQAPTLQMAMKWLREVHKTEIRVIYDNDKLCWYGACNPMGESQILLGLGRKCKSYEEACEEAIKYCLEKLI